MNRRDIIVIAVLINAGLLVVLFTSALKSDRSEPTLVMETCLQSPAHQSQASQAQSFPALQVKGDEVDQVLNQFAIVSTPMQETTIPSSSPLLQTAPTSSTVDTTFLPEAQHLAPSSDTTPQMFKEVKVKKGDALEKIARANRTSIQEIMRLNKLSSTQLKIGQVLKIPTKETKQASSNIKRVEEHVYIVKNGDNPWTIAVKNNMKLEDLLQLNNLDEERARKLQPGDQLKIR